MDEIGKIAEAMRALGEAAEKALPANNKLSDFGYNCPPLNAIDLKRLAVDVANQIDKIDRARISSKFKSTEIVSRIQLVQANTVPYFGNGNAATAWQAYVATIDWVSSSFEQFFEREIDWKAVADSNKLPRSFANRLRSLDTVLDRHKERTENLSQQISIINDAYETALNLPADTAEMRAVKEDIEKLKRDAAADQAQAAISAEKASQTLESIRITEAEATKLLENTVSAYTAATTKGLGEAFQTRADALSKSMSVWVGWLVLALITGALIGALRIHTLQTLLTEQAPARLIWVNLIFSVLSLAAPVWFAWIATKQIGHRFRLSEDYAFKASVAKAYEGYRREAARLDDDFVKRLFGSILDRLEEPPIRFVENETPGTPWQEFFSSKISVPGVTTRRSAPSATASSETTAAKPDPAE